MQFVRNYIKELKKGVTPQIPNCPMCGGNLKVVIFGYPTKEVEMLAADNLFNIQLGGCLCFGDDRDDVFYCPKYQTGFTEELVKNELIVCPLEASNHIRKSECKNYEWLSKRYTLLEDREKICNMICPMMGKHVIVETSEGKVYQGRLVKTFEYTVSEPDNMIELEERTGEYSANYAS